MTALTSRVAYGELAPGDVIVGSEDWAGLTHCLVVSVRASESRAGELELWFWYAHRQELTCLYPLARWQTSVLAV